MASVAIELWKDHTATARDVEDRYTVPRTPLGNLISLSNYFVSVIHTFGLRDSINGVIYRNRLVSAQFRPGWMR